jgi:hypothetical protein
VAAMSQDIRRMSHEDLGALNARARERQEVQVSPTMLRVRQIMAEAKTDTTGPDPEQTRRQKSGDVPEAEPVEPEQLQLL